MLKFGQVMQHGYVVADVEETAAAWASRAGVGPFYVIDQDLDDYLYRGQRLDVRLRIGVSYWNDLQIELIQPLSAAPTHYHHALKNPGALNHYAVLCADVDDKLKEGGLESRVVHRGRLPSVRFAYVEDYLPDGATLELMQADALALQAMAVMKASALRWDGARPLRSHADLAADAAALRA